MRDDPVVVALVLRAREGDAAAWDAIVERYAPLLWGVCARYGVTGSDADDVAGGVWLRLVERLDTLHEPAALPGWLVRTTQRQCLQLLRARKRQVPVDAPSLAPTGRRTTAWTARYWWPSGGTPCAWPSPSCRTGAGSC